MFRDKNSTLVAGLSVSSGVLRMTGAKGTFVYRVNRKGVPLAGAEELTASQLKRFKVGLRAHPERGFGSLGVS